MHKPWISSPLAGAWRTALWGAALGSLAATGLAGPQVTPFEIESALEPQGEIDRLVFSQLEEQGIQPAFLCSDGVFLRRVYLDVIGTLPEPGQARSFLEDPSAGKRAALIDELLEREEFADYWALKWGDLLRVKAEFPINLWPNAVQAYHRWIRTSIKENKPYDVFVRELLTSSGSNFRVPQVNFYRALQGEGPEAICGVVALTFMGTQVKNWPEERLDDMAVFFSKVGFKSTMEWKEEIVFFDATQGEEPQKKRGRKSKAQRSRLTARFPDGTEVDLLPEQDPRLVFADWLIDPENPWFSASIVNRIWFWLQGRGIVHPADDFGPDNPAVHPELLAFLERELIAADYDLKQVYRLILNSNTYQLSSIPRCDDPRAEAFFAHYPVRRLDAEVLIDALCQITGTTEEYSSPIPEPFTFLPEGLRSIALTDGSITSPFLEMFGRPPRDTGLESERDNDPTPTQRLHLLNSSHVRSKIEGSGRLRTLFRSNRRPGRAIDSLYLLVLSRHPTRGERATVQEYFQEYVQAGSRGNREAVTDLVWALINTPEFLYRH